MRRVFADTLYWVAVLDVRDPWHEAAARVAQQVGRARIVTTEDVLVEVLNAFSASGPHARRWAARYVRGLCTRTAVDVVGRDRTRLLAGIDLYDQRPDKEYSLTDCISMLVMRERRLTEVLTNDHHFEQEGFKILLPER